ncbi:transketolase [Pasteuria penetrans]|uniref:transketolase n=1 Tax=Pasteuria penetrans TaxID=86005 RepID=UPI0011EFA600|nr:transketolase [Pasteuria penetrans]
MDDTLVSQAIHAIRLLSIDQVEKARSGHPGLPMGAAAMSYVLWARVRRHHPNNPNWWNRDRFVLSAGHGSALLYSLLYLFGYSVALEDLKSFRQRGSRTPGHPEYGVTPGVEATTGPLGQGIANGVGMAMAEAHCAAVHNRPGFPSLVDHYTYVLCSDGDLMEGVASEACSLAGHLGLGKLIVLLDANAVTLDGSLKDSYSEDTATRFTAYNWQVLRVADGNDTAEIERALLLARENKTQPTLIMAHTVIGYGSPNRSNSSEAHGKPLGKEEAALVRVAYGWPHQEPFYVPLEVAHHFTVIQQQLIMKYQVWESQWNYYRQRFPEEANALHEIMEGEFSFHGDFEGPDFEGLHSLATRTASHKTLTAVAPMAPWLVGGSADLASSNLTTLEGAGFFSRATPEGRNIAFGVREHAMGAILNGMTLHGGVRCFGATFLVFSDYLRPSLRLAAMMELPVLYVFTHDSLAVGEDGPTHQPVEQLAALRSIPNLTVFRPADAHETVVAWNYALTQTSGPVALILSRQNLPILRETAGRKEDMIKGGYILSEAGDTPEGILIATGSEVGLALEAQAFLRNQGTSVRVVSLPSWELFSAQSPAYREEVLPQHLTRRLSIEAASPLGWERWVGDQGAILGVNEFGASMQGDVIMRERGFSVGNVVQQWENLQGKKNG